MTHYREPIDFCVKRLEEAEQTLLKWANFAVGGVSLNGLSQNLVIALSNDLNFSPTRVELDKLANASKSGNVDAKNELFSSLRYLGFSSLESLVVENKYNSEESEDITEIQFKVEKRLAFLKDKNWAEADRIRDELLSQGIQLSDSKDSTTGERITTWEVKR